jgi:HEAT repeat protein
VTARGTAAALAICVLLAAGCSLLPEQSTLGRIMRDDDVTRLRGDLSADRAWVREHAAVRLGQLGAADALPDLEERLGSDPDAWVRARSAEAFGAIAVPGTAGPLVAALDDESIDVRLAAVGALARIGGREASDALTALRDAPDLLVRGAASDALRRLEGQ